MSTPRRPCPRSSGAPITATARRSDSGCSATACKASVRLVQHSEASGAAVRVLLADDDAAFIESLRPLIDHQPELAVVGCAYDGLAAIELADELVPDAVVIDLHMPLVDGVAAVARLRQDHASICL